MMSDEEVVAEWIRVGPSKGDKVLSVKQPFAGLIVAQFKPFENRTWTTKYRGPIWIHASKKPFKDWKDGLREWSGIQDRELDALDDLTGIAGAIVGCAWLDMVYPKELLPREHTGNVHAEGPFCWHFTAADELEEPVPCKGKLQLFEYQK